jgi:hypothetical protein
MINGFSYIPSKPGKLVQGIKGNRVPKGAIKGGCGTFIVRNTPPKMIVTLVDEDGNKVSTDIAGTVRPFFSDDNKRLSEEVARKIYRQIAGRKTETENISEKMLKNAYIMATSQ